MLKSLSLPLAILNPLSVNIASSPSKLAESSISCMIANLTGGVKESVLAAISAISERQRLARLSLPQVCLSLPQTICTHKSAILGHTLTSMQITLVAQVVSHQNIHKAVTEAQRHGSIESVIVDTLGLMALTDRSKSPCLYS